MTFLDKVKALDAKATPGPWRWVLNMRAKEIQLVSRGNLYVMDFNRWGMAGARPRFRHAGGMDVMVNADVFGVEIEGREHHRSWLQGIHHPDADLPVLLRNSASRIAAVVEEARQVMSLLAAHGSAIVPHLLDTDDNAGERLRSALTALDADGGA